MATNFPPDVLAMNVGVWGTDADQNLSIFTIGSSSVELKATAVATEVESRKFSPIEPGLPYALRFVTRASAAGGGDTLRLTAVQYESDQSTVAETKVVFLGAMNAVDTFEVREIIFTSHSSAKWVKLRFRKTANSFNAYLDYWSLRRAAARFEVYRNAALSMDTGWNKVVMDVESYDWGGIYDESANERFVAPYTMHMVFSASAEFAAIGDGKEFRAGLYLTPVGGAAALVKQFDVKTAGAAGAIAVGGSTELQVLKGEFVEFYVNNGDTGAEALTVGQDTVYFAGHEIR